MDVRLPSIAVIVLVVGGCADPCRDDGLFQENSGNCPVAGETGRGSESTSLAPDPSSSTTQ